MTTPQISRKKLQKSDLLPSAPLKNEEQDKNQRRDLSLAKTINNAQEIKIVWVIKSNLFFPFVITLVSLVHRLPHAEALHLAFQTRVPGARWLRWAGCEQKPLPA